VAEQYGDVREVGELAGELFEAVPAFHRGRLAHPYQSAPPVAGITPRRWQRIGRAGQGSAGRGGGVRCERDPLAPGRWRDGAGVEVVALDAVGDHHGAGDVVGGGQVGGGELADRQHHVGGVHQGAFGGDQVVEGAHGGRGEVAADHDRRPLRGGTSGVVQGFGLPGGGLHDIRPRGGQGLVHCLPVDVEIVGAR
jgi:hypothetical protein